MEKLRNGGVMDAPEYSTDETLQLIYAQGYEDGHAATTNGGTDMTETTHSIATFPHRENGVWLAGLLRAKGIPHQVTVVSQDDFDECDNEAPGTTHVYVSEPDAAIGNEPIGDASRPRGRASWQWAVDGLAVRRREIR